MKIAIIGTGISGLGTAYLLNKDHDITVYEKNSYIGGHSRTIEVPSGDKTVAVDTGFIVFNNWNYPNLMGLFDVLDVPYQKSPMSFGVSISDGWLEYASGGLFAQKKNLLRPQFWGMLYDILVFNKKAQKFIESDPSLTLGACLEKLSLGRWFKEYYILAMGAAIWSSPISSIMEFPARTFIRFFQNHGLLNINNRPQWYTVTGGSREYVARLTASFADKIRLDTAVDAVLPKENGIYVRDKQGHLESYDHVIFACHADEAMKMIPRDIHDEYKPIQDFRYQNNEIIVHKDKSFMPKEEGCWASWIYLSENKKDDQPAVSLSYWMNNLQDLDTDEPVIVTLNPGRRPNEELIVDEHHFTHPIFDEPAVRAQGKINTIQGKNNLWFCGAYQRYGFHEDGLLSAVNIAEKFEVSIPWKS